MMRTLDVVPSPVMSSCAVATRAIRDAVGCWICCQGCRELQNMLLWNSFVLNANDHTALPSRGEARYRPWSTWCPQHPTQAYMIRKLYHHELDQALSCLSYIFMVPLGPRLVLSTSCSPLAAVIFTWRAWAALATSALGFKDLTAAIDTQVTLILPRGSMKLERMLIWWNLWLCCALNRGKVSLLLHL